MELIFTQSSSRTWLVYDEGAYTLDLSRTRMRTWQDHLLENIKVFKDDTGSYTITADEVHFRYICDFTAKIHNVYQFELPQDNATNK